MAISSPCGSHLAANQEGEISARACGSAGRRSAEGHPDGGKGSTAWQSSDQLFAQARRHHPSLRSRPAPSRMRRLTQPSQQPSITALMPVHIRHPTSSASAIRGYFGSGPACWHPMRHASGQPGAGLIAGRISPWSLMRCAGWRARHTAGSRSRRWSELNGGPARESKSINGIVNDNQASAAEWRPASSRDLTWW